MRTLWRLAPYIRRTMGILIASILLSLVAQATAIATPKLIQLIVAEVFEEARADRVPLYVTIILALALVRSVVLYAEITLGSRQGERVLRYLRRDLYERLCELSVRYFDRVRTGQLLSRTTSDFDPLGGTLIWGGRLIFRSLVLFVGAFVVCAMMDWRLAVAGLAPMPLISVTAYIIGSRLRPLFSDARERLGGMTSFLQENLRGIRVVHIFCREEREIERFVQQSSALRDSNFRSSALDGIYYPLTGLWSALGGLFALWYGGRLVMAGEVTLSQFIAVNSYILMLGLPMRMMGYMTSMAVRAMVSAQRIFAIMDEEPDVADVAGAEHLKRIEGRIEFRDVSFAYEDGRPVLSGVSFAIEPGETVGILGATGSGKSSLLNMIPRFYDVTDGQVLVDGHDVRGLRRHELRSQIGFVFQDPLLFSGTIRENIAFGKPEATDEEIIAASKLAALHDFVSELEDGYNTVIGERGLTVSGGQRQRVSIARALVVDPRILVLDDCTSSVDTYTEFRIQEALDQLRKGRTTLIVAQRASAVAHADRLILVDAGRVVEEGTPEALAADPTSHYAALLDLQKREDLAIAS